MDSSFWIIFPDVPNLIEETRFLHKHYESHWLMSNKSTLEIRLRNAVDLAAAAANEE